MGRSPVMEAGTTERDDRAVVMLTRFREEVPPMSYRAHVRGRTRLMAEIGGPATTRTGPVRLPRRAVFAGAAAVTLGVALAGAQLTGLAGGSDRAQAATVLKDAAVVAAAARDEVPRPGQFVYRRILRLDAEGRPVRIEIWNSADGTRPGRSRMATRGHEDVEPTDPYSPADGLLLAPYLVLAKLPTDPDALLNKIYADPTVAKNMTNNRVTREAAAWELIRDLVDTAPSAQRAALFQAAAKIDGITSQDGVADAAGRVGVAVGLLYPGLGTVQLIFDRDSHAFLGERILVPGSKTQVHSVDTLQLAAVVDAVGRHPAGDHPGPDPWSAPTGNVPTDATQPSQPFSQTSTAPLHTGHGESQSSSWTSTAPLHTGHGESQSSSWTSTAPLHTGHGGTTPSSERSVKAVPTSPIASD
ncbi:MAG TPA: CU044_5270 family protein [Kineosporiaceae bacterium]